MSFIVVIPARFSSMRLPGKPLAVIDDKTMIQHVYEQALISDAEKVIVATDDQRIFDVVQGFGGEVCMTDPEHVSGTDRIREVAEQYQLADDCIVVNVQGDEPLIPPEVINQVAKNLQQSTQVSAATLSEAITNEGDYCNPNVVKVVADNQSLALYFSRASIPFSRDVPPSHLLAEEAKNELVQRHIGIYAYRVSLLHRFVKWQPALLEQVEKLEQLRILAYGERIHIQKACKTVPGGVDTPEDLARIKGMLAS